MSQITFDYLPSLVGLQIGHARHEAAPTGCTVFLCPPSTVGSVDVRGPAPGSRESALLRADKPVSVVHAVTLAGGSAFGLGAADGVMRFLREKDIGHPTPVRPIPIVPAAIVYDLLLSGGEHFPDADLGYAAAQQARPDNREQGNIGAGTGVTVGKWGGFRAMMKGGFGLASVSEAGNTVMAAAVVNSIGDVVAADGSVLAGARGEAGGWQVEQDPFRRLPVPPPVPGSNTTLVVVATDAGLNKVLCQRLAQRAHDGLALAIRPVHTSHDGDTVFALATGQKRFADFDLIGTMAVAAVAEAIRNGVRHAHSMPSAPGLAG